MPIVFSLIGIAVIILCLLVLKKTGGMWYRRKVREAIDADIKDAKRSDSEDRIG